MTRALVLALAATLFASVWLWGSKNTVQGERDAAITARDAMAATLTAERAARTAERQAATRLAQIGDDYENDRTAAEAVPEAVVADLRAGALRLRNDLATCHTQRLSDATAGTVERDAGAQLRSEVAGAAVRIVRDADDHVRACQAVIAADRAGAG